MVVEVISFEIGNCRRRQ